jgi:demethylmenaquinone methyltransferase/2-methoxy-6-polyprenyl-1,4-benzoquinol methylase
MPDSSQVTPYKDVHTSKKKQVTSMFDGIAPYYDFLNRFLSLGIDVIWRKKAIKQLQNVRHNTILDVATGTADLAIEAALSLKPLKINGLDISKEMLRLGDKKIEDKNLTSVITLEHGDSENLPYQSDSFDVAMSAYGVRNFENLIAGLKEMYRVIQPGGTIMVLEFSKPKVFPLKQFFGIYFKYLLPLIGRIKSRDTKAYSYLYESVQVFPDYHQFTSKLEEAGFKQTKFIPLTGGICTIYLGTK